MFELSFTHFTETEYILNNGYKIEQKLTGCIIRKLHSTPKPFHTISEILNVI
jgi:hypothetical protein